ncbi:multiheme c-type cytochrome [Novosphingobium sp. LASN5T]|uniref:multiheme c-type cytochrome n=1 Tax=Novosphingobium sp. LASN5T TaxID=2491021 RepID=UPI000F5D973B|nr:multiheme c-type cytochrome [Novosphingobium sp. LASN5T]RQW45443.1 hypothetical protein EH199_04060 [Novosphingobium sp. LASN5T]
MTQPSAFRRPAALFRRLRALPLAWLLAALAVLAVPSALWASGEEVPQKVKYVRAPAAPRGQPGDTAEEQWAFVDQKNAGCVSCHTASDHKTMHASPAVVLSCVDCHGGNNQVVADRSWNRGSMEYVGAMKDAHVLPRFPVAWGWPSSANPKRSYALLAKESPEFIRFVNPSDYRVARDSCGACHMNIIEASERSLMSTGAMLWGGAAYNNGIVPFKNYMFGESFTRQGEPALLKSASKEIGPDGKPMWGTVTPQEKARGALPVLYPLPRWHTIPPADVFRVFEDGGRTINPQFPEIGLPNSTGLIQRLDEPGRPDLKQSNRGPATGLRVAIPVLNIHKTRLNDPFLFQMGTNDQPGDYRSSGCASCHVIYANDREPRHSLNYGKCGRDGQTITADPTINSLREGQHRAGKYGSYDAAKEEHKTRVRGTVLGGQGGYLQADASDSAASKDLAGDCARAIASAEQLTFSPAAGVAPHGSMDAHAMGQAEAHATAGLDKAGHAVPAPAGGHEGGPVAMQDRERGHPLVHAFTRAIPTAQCMNCHMHQPNIFLNTYLGYIMWDYESDADSMWPGPENRAPKPAGMSDADYQRIFKKQFHPNMAEAREILDRNPEAASTHGLWRDVEFLRNVYDLNPQLKNTQFADYHGHGWNFRAILKRDRRGNLLDDEGDMSSYGTDKAHIVNPDDPEKWRKSGANGTMEGKFVEPGPDNPGKAVHMMDIHAQLGMQCADCHFSQDSHGNGMIMGEVANAVEIGCKDCHGTPDAYPTLMTSNLAAPPKGNNLSLLRNADGQRRFEWMKAADGRRVLIQRSIIDPNLSWRVSLVKDSVDARFAGKVDDLGKPIFNPKAARAKLMAKSAAQDGVYKFGTGVPKEQRAHRDDDMACFTCHLSWTTSCAGCHLPIEANWKSTTHKYEEDYTRNYATYNPQVARDDMFQLGKHQRNKTSGSDPVQFDKDGNPVSGKAITAPIRSSSALILSSTNINRERIYVQQPPISAIGYSSQAFAPHFPHTVRKNETKQCTDCHLSQQDDNNAIMAQLLLLGTNYVNFVGMNAWFGLDGGFEAVRVTEWDEPQAVIGSYLHRYAYPDYWKQHVEKNGRELKDWTRGGVIDGKLSEETKGREQFTNVTKGTSDAVRCLQMRGEYMFVAEGKGGFRAYDIASVSNKGFSERITTAPFSPLGHDTHVDTKNATCMALPTNQAIAPTRNTPELRHLNQEQPFSPIYHYAFVTDAVEGLIAVNVDTLADGEFRNNFFRRALTFNPDGVLTGARHITLAGDYAYIVTDKALVTVHLPKPWSPGKPCEASEEKGGETCLDPRVTSVVPLKDPRSTAVQFRYLWVTTANGLELMDVTNLARPVPVPQATVPLADARRVYVARTYAYVAAKAQGLVIVDVTAPTRPAIQQAFTADGQLNDAEDVIVASTNASLFAYVADGRNGMKVVQLTSPSSQPNFYGFSPEPRPELIAWAHTPSPALALSKGLDRDRGVDETGGQIAIFGRLGSRPFNRAEMEELFLNDRREPFRVSNAVDMNLWVGATTAPQLMARTDR